MNQRLLSFGRSTVGLAYDNGRPAQLVDFLFKNIPGSVDKEPWTVLRLEDHGDTDGLWLWQDERLVSKHSSPESMANHLMSQVCYTLAYESKAGLLLHSAAVQSNKKGIILPGKTGSGKSTLTAWLIKNGCNYLSDEMVYVANGSPYINGFARPITIKSPARYLLEDLIGDKSASSAILHSEPVDMVDPELFGGQVVGGKSSLDLIIFPHFQTDNEIELLQLSKAQAAFELMKCLANARNLAGHGLSEAVRIAKGRPAYSLRYGNTEQAGHSVFDLLDG